MRWEGVLINPPLVLWGVSPSHKFNLNRKDLTRPFTADDVNGLSLIFEYESIDLNK
jgi:hypothetical protein